MKSRVNIISIAVADLERAVVFYRDGLGLPCEGEPSAGTDHVAFPLEGELSLVLYHRDSLARDAQTDPGPPGMPQFILTQFVEDRREVDEVLARALAAGGEAVGFPEEHPWGYFARFKDLDGHLWEIMSDTSAHLPDETSSREN